MFFKQTAFLNIGISGKHSILKHVSSNDADEKVQMLIVN